jgi:hypothetical protein
MRGYSNSIPSGLMGYAAFPFPAFHAGLFKFNPFGIDGLCRLPVPRISCGAIQIQSLRDLLMQNAKSEMQNRK